MLVYHSIAFQFLLVFLQVVKDVGLTGQVPAVRRTLEGFVFRVKVMLTNHRCGNAFWVGNLKNRDLKVMPASSFVLAYFVLCVQEAQRSRVRM